MDVTNFVAAVEPWLGERDGPLRAHLSLAIRQAISNGQLPRETRIPPERALATAFHVSRPTISGVIEDLRSLGLISSRQGSGSWIKGSPRTQASPIPFFERIQANGSIDLASAAAPDASLVAATRIESRDLLAVDPTIGVSPTGHLKLCEQVAARANKFSPTHAANVMITSGAHQALSLLIAALAPRGSTVLLEETTYGGLVDMVHANGCLPIAIPRDEDGPQPAQLSELITRHRPSMIIVVASVHSPSGAVAPPDRAIDIANVLLDTDAHVVLDETFSDLDFVGHDRVLSRLLGEQAIRTGSLSKSIWAGLRVGWIIAAETTTAEVARRRWQQFDLGISAPSQLFATAVMEQIDGLLPSRNKQLRDKERWIREKIEDEFPMWQVSRVDGGLAMWVELPEDGQNFAQFAAARNVAVLPGSACRVDQQPTNHIRLCFDRPIDVLEDAFSRLLST